MITTVGGDLELLKYVDEAKKYYLLDSLQSAAMMRKCSLERMDIFDKFRMFVEGKDYWEVAAHFGMSEGGCRENIKRARGKIIVYLKLLEMGLL